MTGESNTWILAVQKLMAFYVLASYIIMAFASWKLPDYHLERSIHIVFTLIDIKNRILLIAVNAILFFFDSFFEVAFRDNNKKIFSTQTQALLLCYSSSVSFIDGTRPVIIHFTELEPTCPHR